MKQRKYSKTRDYLGVFSVVQKNFLQVFNFQLDVILSKQHLLYWISPNSATVGYIRPRYCK